MLRVFALLATGIFLVGLPQTGSAQISNLALGQAKSRLACGAGIVVSSVFLPNGSLQVTCARNPAETSSTASSTTATATTTATTPAAVIAQTTGLTATAGLTVVGAVAVVGLITGGGEVFDSTITSGTGAIGVDR